ncbi:uncharacterized protein LOC121836099 isoform X2 [Ixodes scapularis]|uniref:uncharacterized protein LOC121836099 isoform X2 n=1 Tax=Ixodes scapularis TaxID=6945 RepID=UPI001C389F2F|nr:uncharacterized protein LOC121836099 isoform X2 [Ixodes scapularis]
MIKARRPHRARVKFAKRQAWTCVARSPRDGLTHQRLLRCCLCFCCTVQIISDVIRGFTILGYVLMLTAPRYEVTKLHRQDEKPLINPHYVAVAIIVESCIEILFSVVLIVGVIKAEHRLLLPWMIWCLFNILYLFVIAVMQVLAAVFASSTHALGSAMGSWIGFFVSVYFLKCVLSYYQLLRISSDAKLKHEDESMEIPLSADATAREGPGRSNSA